MEHSLLSPMLNALESIREDPIARCFEIGDVLFAQFSCPPETVRIWTQTDYLMHVVSGTSEWKIAAGPSSAKAGESVFFRKGAYVLPEHSAHDLCVQMYFIPDAFVRETIVHLSAELPDAGAVDAVVPATVIPVVNDAALSAFFQVMRVYFAADEDPPQALLKLKLRELLTSILLSRSNAVLSAYFRSLATWALPPIATIMEANYHYNLPLQTFAELCHRSLSSFKRDFQKYYRTSPGKWLLERRLERAFSLLRTTNLTVTEIMLECGFEDLSHFSKAFKEKFGRPPERAAFRECVTAHFPRESLEPVRQQS
jgi:AraC-like DNA-binding protein